MKARLDGFMCLWGLLRKAEGGASEGIELFFECSLCIRFGTWEASFTADCVCTVKPAPEKASFTGFSNVRIWEALEVPGFEEPSTKLGLRPSEGLVETSF